MHMAGTCRLGCLRACSSWKGASGIDRLTASLARMNEDMEKRPRKSVLRSILNLALQVGAACNHQASRSVPGMHNRLRKQLPSF